jgi:hypothetical protein
VVQSLVPAGAISIEPPATPDSASLVSTVSWVGFAGFCGSKLTDGGASSMWIVIELVPVFGWPWGSTALFHAAQVTVWMPSPLTATPAAGYDADFDPSSLQVTPPTPDGPAEAVASTVTA